MWINIAVYLLKIKRHNSFCIILKPSKTVPNSSSQTSRFATIRLSQHFLAPYVNWCYNQGSPNILVWTLPEKRKFLVSAFIEIFNLRIIISALFVVRWFLWKSLYSLKDFIVSKLNKIRFISAIGKFWDTFEAQSIAAVNIWWKQKSKWWSTFCNNCFIKDSFLILEII